MTRTDLCLSTARPAAGHLAKSVGMTGDGPLSEELNDDSNQSTGENAGVPRCASGDVS